MHNFVGSAVINFHIKSGTSKASGEKYVVFSQKKLHTLISSHPTADRICMQEVQQIKKTINNRRRLKGYKGLPAPTSYLLNAPPPPYSPADDCPIPSEQSSFQRTANSPSLPPPYESVPHVSNRSSPPSYDSSPGVPGPSGIQQPGTCIRRESTEIRSQSEERCIVSSSESGDSVQSTFSRIGRVQRPRVSYSTFSPIQNIEMRSFRNAATVSCDAVDSNEPSQSRSTTIEETEL